MEFSFHNKDNVSYIFEKEHHIHQDLNKSTSDTDTKSYIDKSNMHGTSQDISSTESIGVS